MSGYIIHLDNETELAHYGVRGMKWKKGKKSLVKPMLDPRKVRRSDRLGLNRSSKKVENQIYKNLQSGKKMNKTYRIGRQKIYFDQDSDGNSANIINGTARYSQEKAALRAVAKAYNRDLKARESKKPINRGKKLIKKWLKKIF